ncbi:MAG: T9SS type A sorting domain-containing protein [Cyclobacteriaceae bacterium]|nr:T9SS type A sorting domain-containing protein [Cyclobacteriaceae bacterium]
MFFNKFKLKSIFILALVLVFFTNIVQVAAQEYLEEYSSHHLILKEYSKKYPHNANRTGLDTLDLPFIDDFSGSIVFPDEKKWLDRDVYINFGYSVNPISYNSATFDGLRGDGTPYAPHSPNARGIADKLTSMPINLDYQESDSIYISFYYQAQGLGTQPEIEDSLILQFLDTYDSTWISVWRAQGQALSDYKIVNIPIRDSIFRVNGFQFRFLNYASLAGSFDHWNVDYVYLNINRTADDTLMNDVAFTHPANSLLSDYREMPWRQFKANPTANMKDSMNVRIKNLSGSPKALSYTYDVLDANNTSLISNTSTGNPFPGTREQYLNFLNNFAFPSNSDDTATFQVYNHINANIDQNRNNDTVRHFQKFQHYYAYDDGTAERAYGLNAYGAKIAYQFDLDQADTLTGIRVHFAQMNQNVELEPFRLTIWSSLTPEEIIYQRDDSVSYPTYEEGVNSFTLYNIPGDLVLSGRVYIGWVQTNNRELHVGFDRNSDARGKMFYNISGTWLPSTFEGAWMIRPVFGTPVDDFLVSDKKEIANKRNINQLKVFPNPAHNLINIQSESEMIASISIFDLSGRNIYTQENIHESNIQINSSQFANGTYLLRAIDKNCRVFTNKVLIYH